MRTPAATSRYQGRRTYHRARTQAAMAAGWTLDSCALGAGHVNRRRADGRTTYIPSKEVADAVRRGGRRTGGAVASRAFICRCRRWWWRRSFTGGVHIGGHGRAAGEAPAYDMDDTHARRPRSCIDIDSACARVAALPPLRGITPHWRRAGAAVCSRVPFSAMRAMPLGRHSPVLRVRRRAHDTAYPQHCLPRTCTPLSPPVTAVRIERRRR